MIENLVWDSSGQLQTGLSDEALKQALKDPEYSVWVNIYDEPLISSRALLGDVFKFHPLAIEDALEETHVPKVDDWESYLYLVLRLIDPKQDFNTGIETRELDVFIGKRFIVTHQMKGNLGIEKIWQVVQKGPRQMISGPVNILYLIMDSTADNFISAADQIDIILNGMEDKLFDDPESSLLEEIFSFKRGLLNLRQVVAPQREVMNKLARGDYALLGEEGRLYFRDVYDHFLRLYEIIEDLRDLTGSTLEIYLSVVNNRMSSVMKTLTIITTLFMPISFLTGFFGMNFFKPVQDIPAWTGSIVFHIALGLIVLVPIGMLLYSLRRGWMKS
jgi:magnesium transporter